MSARSVDVVIFGGTHREVIAYCEAVLLVNPGSPTLPARRRDGEFGTLGILEIKGGVATVEIVHLREDRIALQTRVPRGHHKNEDQ